MEFLLEYLEDTEISYIALQEHLRNRERESAIAWLQVPNYRENYQSAYKKCVTFQKDETQTGPLELRLKYGVNILLQKEFPMLIFVQTQFVSDENLFTYNAYKTE